MPPREIDRPSWAQLVETVGQAKDQLRAELTTVQSRHHEDISQIRGDVIRGFANLEERFNGHEAWHTQQLTSQVQSSPTLHLNKIMAIVAVLSLIVTVVTLLLPHLH